MDSEGADILRRCVANGRAYRAIVAYAVFLATQNVLAYCAGAAPLLVLPAFVFLALLDAHYSPAAAEAAAPLAFALRCAGAFGAYMFGLTHAARYALFPLLEHAVALLGAAARA